MAGGDIWFDVHLTFYSNTLSSNDMMTSLRWYECVVNVERHENQYKNDVQHSKIVN